MSTPVSENASKIKVRYSSYTVHTDIGKVYKYKIKSSSTESLRKSTEKHDCTRGNKLSRNCIYRGIQGQVVCSKDLMDDCARHISNMQDFAANLHLHSYCNFIYVIQVGAVTVSSYTNQHCLKETMFETFTCSKTILKYSYNIECRVLVRRV